MLDRFSMDILWLTYSVGRFITSLTPPDKRSSQFILQCNGFLVALLGRQGFTYTAEQVVYIAKKKTHTHQYHKCITFVFLFQCMINFISKFFSDSSCVVCFRYYPTPEDIWHEIEVVQCTSGLPSNLLFLQCNNEMKLHQTPTVSCWGELTWQKYDYKWVP